MVRRGGSLPPERPRTVPRSCTWCRPRSGPSGAVDALAGPYAVSAVLLVVAGVLEVRRPRAAVDALATLGVSVASWVVRVGAAAGALVGAVALGAGGGEV